MTSHPARIALFTDSFHEVNGVALTSRQFESYAGHHGIPMFSCHAGPETAAWTHGSIERWEWKRSPVGLELEADLSFDLLASRYLARIRPALRAFGPDFIHITSPGDCGLLGVALAHEMRIPIAGSWHTNIHEFGARRLERLIRFLGGHASQVIGKRVEDRILDFSLIFYRLAKVLFAPNPELVHLLEKRLQRPCGLMSRGVDTALFSPARRRRTDSILRVGYVGRLSAEKNLVDFKVIEDELLAAGAAFEIVFVGHGSLRQGLAASLRRSRFTGVLKGEALADEYANFDLFVFPSQTDTFGNVVLEALASGVPVIVTDRGGPRFLVRDRETGFITSSVVEIIQRVKQLISDSALRQQMSTAARAYTLAHHDWDSVFGAVYSRYDAFRSGEVCSGVATPQAVPNC